MVMMVFFEGTHDPIPSTVRFMDIPPVITQTARAGIRICAGVKRHYIFGSLEDPDQAVIAALSGLDKLTKTAKAACNIRDYVTLLIEETILRLSMDLSPPTEELLTLATFANPALKSDPKSVVKIEPFRHTDAALITNLEKDLLVLLYYCHTANVSRSPDDAVKEMERVAQKHGSFARLDGRKEPITETEVSTITITVFS